MEGDREENDPYVPRPFAILSLALACELLSFLLSRAYASNTYATGLFHPAMLNAVLTGGHRCEGIREHRGRPNIVGPLAAYQVTR